MSKVKFVGKKFSAASLAGIAQVNKILAEYQAGGYRLTLRQLYYQHVARGLIENTVRSYKNLGSLVSDARLAGLIDWDMIEDRGRSTESLSHWEDPAQIIRAAAYSFRLDHWEGQDVFVLVMVEKQALEGVLLPVCQSLDITFCANKGYSSSSTFYSIGRMLSERESQGMRPVVLYFGDHDPSGVDMTRDVDDRLCLFSRLGVEVRRLALNMDQIERWSPPPNPAKETDSRFEKYLAEFGDTSWELDAVEPRELDRLVRSEIADLVDQDLMDEVIEREKAMKADLQSWADNYKPPES